MNVYVGNRLPSTYQEVEYISSSGTQRIDTGYSYGGGGYLRIDAKFMFNSVPTSNADFIYGVIGRSSNNRFLGINYNSGNTFQFASGTEYSTNIGGTTGIIYDTMMKYEGGTMTMKVNNNTLSISSTGNMYQGHSLPIFCRWDNGNQIYDYPSKIKLYSFKIYTSGTTLVRDFIPCYRKSDGVIGLYDLVNNQFYTNSGTGTFTKGSDVVLCELQNAYIGEYIPLIQNASLLGNTDTKQDVQGVRFSPDGTKMIVGFWNSFCVTEYTLSTPFNPSTKTEIRTLSGTYQNSGMWFNHDGNIMILSTRVNKSFPTYIQKYTLSTPFALNTATLVQSYSVGGKFTSGVCLSDDGKKIYINIDGEGIYQGTMSTAFDLSTISLSSGMFSSGGRGIALRGNGKILYTSNSNSVGDYGLISQYKLDTPYDILGSKTLLSTFNAGGGEGTALWVSEDMGYFSWCLGGNTSKDVRIFKTN